MDAKRLVAIGHYSPCHDEILADPAFEQTWQAAIDARLDALPECLDEDAQLAQNDKIEIEGDK